MLKTARTREIRLELSILGVLIGIFTIFFIGNFQVFSKFDIYYSFMSTIPFSGIMALAMTFVVISTWTFHPRPPKHLLINRLFC